MAYATIRKREREAACLYHAVQSARALLFPESRVLVVEVSVRLSSNVKHKRRSVGQNTVIGHQLDSTNLRLNELLVAREHKH